MSTQTTYLLATRSAGKLRELRELFDQFVASSKSSDQIRIIDLDEAGLPERPEEDTIECYETFEANAQAKAEYFHRLSGLPTFADDSGLAVHALNGAPGVRSKRWSGRTDLSGAALDASNNEKLMAALANVPEGSARSSEYVCAAAFVNGEQRQVTLGQTLGHMLPSPRGEKGFGYDAYFFSSELNKTFGEAETAEKRVVSHRGKAFTGLLEHLFMKNSSNS